MDRLVVLHIEDDNDYHFLFSQYLGDSISLLWGVNREQTLMHLNENKIDAIVFDGEIHGWKGHIEEVLSIVKDVPHIILSGSVYSKILEFKEKGYLAHQKGREGMAAVVGYIKSLEDSRK